MVILMSASPIVISCFSADFLFGSDESGANISVEPVAVRMACEAMGLPADSVISWVVPNVLACPDSSFVATARCGDSSVEFRLADYYLGPGL